MTSNLHVSDIIKQVRLEFLATNKALSSFHDINCGWCDLFAEVVLSQLFSHEQYRFYEMETYELMYIGEEDDYGTLESQLIREKFSFDLPLELMGIEVGYHVWITDGNMHYDAECPEGVINFFELPFFKRYIMNTNIKAF